MHYCLKEDCTGNLLEQSLPDRFRRSGNEPSIQLLCTQRFLLIAEDGWSHEENEHN
jgi:hypothetical protein